MGQIRTDPYRCINLVLFMLAGLCNTIPSNTFITVGPTIRDVYQVSELVVNANAMIYPLMYILTIFPVNFVLEKYGLKIGTLIAEATCIVGLLIRLLINQHFYFFLVGTWVTGCGFCFMMNSPNKLATSWFPVEEIPLANALCLFSIFSSDSLASFISSLFIKEDATKESIFYFILIQTGIVIAFQLLMVIFFKEKPKYPPNYATSRKRQDFLKSLKSLAKNKNYRILFLSMTFVYGFLGVMFVGISWQSKVYGFDGMDAGIVLMVANLVGCVCCVLTGFLFKNSKYRRNSLVLVFGTWFALGVVMLGFESHSRLIFYIGGGLVGMFVFPYLTTMTDFASETAFPVGEAISSGSLLLGGQIFGIICSIITSTFFFDGISLLRTRLGCGFEAFMVMIGGMILALSEEKLRRSEYEKSKREEKQSLLSEI